MIGSSEYINNERKLYSLYVIHNRSIPALSDGLISSARRVLWVARDGKKHKSAALAGNTMCIHPHAAPESTIDTLALHYGNNVPLLEGLGTFGTRLKPTACGASRYTSVKVSKFTQEVVFADIDIIPMQPNYDSTAEEPVHFLPLVPVALLNPSSGIAVGFASNILPRALKDITDAQIAHLRGKRLPKEIPITFTPFNAKSMRTSFDQKDKQRWHFSGSVTKKNTSEVVITDFPYGLTHTKYIDILNEMIEDGSIMDYIDDSKSEINITVKFERRKLNKIMTNDQLLSALHLNTALTENLTLQHLDGVGVGVVKVNDAISQFTQWRLGFFVQRYENLKAKLEVQIQRYRDVLTAINENVGDKARTAKTKDELRKKLQTLGIVYVDYIADLPIYRFTKTEKTAIMNKIKEAEMTLAEYVALLGDEDLRKAEYIKELKQLTKRYG